VAQNDRRLAQMDRAKSALEPVHLAP